MFLSSVYLSVVRNFFKMPIPDQTYFGERPEGGGITYGEVRQITEVKYKLNILKSRLDPLLINQINELSVWGDGGNRKIYSPFPLTVLTLLSIETIGLVICDLERIKAENDYEQSKVIVTPIYHLMDKRLIDKPTKKFYASFEKIHGTDDKKSIKRYSDVIHKYQRNTFNHGYQSRGVYITEKIYDPIQISEENGCLYVNPYLFWQLFKETYESIFNGLITGKNLDWQRNALTYLERLLK